ncbi:MAG: hypothetical protein R3275_03155, partial [Saprospiraceae bacterium]|nr:hypothetical protein [Saprospiraceae bacterium]
MTRIVLLTIKNSLVVLFLGMVSFASAQHSAKGDSCMNYILEQDEILGEKRNHACEKISLSQTIEEYVQALESLNY